MLSYYFGFVTGFFFILVQLTIQCNNSYHSEKRRAMKFVILFLVLLLQFKVMLSSNKYKKISLHVFFIRILASYSWQVDLGKKMRNMLKNLSCKTWKQKQFYSNSTERKLKVSHSLVKVFQWLFILLICVTMLINRFLFNTTLLWYGLVVFTIFEQAQVQSGLLGTFRVGL